MKRLHKKLDFPFRRALAVLLAAAMTFALTGCSVRELHIGQVEVNTGAGTAWITPARGVDRFDIPAADFSAGADGSVTYTGTAYRALQGIDVSTFQQDIDWQAVADSGIAFAVIRAGYRGYGKGGIVENDRFRQNVAGACAAGLRVGLYFFSQAVTPEEAAEEAQWLVDAARDYKIDMPLVFDWENIDQSTVAAGDTVRTAEMTGEDVTACAVAFCETVTAAGYDAAVYGNRWQGYYDYDFAQLKDYAFWVSAPGTADDTLAGLWDETASRSWGGHEMGLTTLRHQADVLLPAGRRATVAVIDTGAEVSHPLLAGRVSARSYDFADNTADVTDVNGHGTATAGLIADLTPDEVDVMVLRVYGDDNLSKPSRVLTALEYALENGATVVNMSIGWPNAIEKGYSFLNSVLAQAYAAGVVVVAAAGNLSQSNPTANADDVYPANQAQVLTVSAVDRSRTFDDTYSASGASVDLCAPGTGVAVAALSGGMTVRSGTSFAAPHVAAAAACVQLAQPGATAARVRRTLCDYAEDLGAPGRDDQYGNGFPVLTQCFHDRLCPGRRFADMPDADAWSHAGLDYCIAAGLMHGMTPVTVAPQALATRAQVVQLLWAAAGSPKTTGPLPFTDVAPGAWYYDAVHWAYRTGLVSGTSPTTFTPDAAITRQDFTVILYAQAGRPAMIGTALAAFPDAGQVAGYAYAALTWAVEQGLIGGVGTPSGPQLAPRGYATRAQVAKILMGYYDK